MEQQLLGCLSFQIPADCAMVLCVPPPLRLMHQLTDYKYITELNDSFFTCITPSITYTKIIGAKTCLKNVTLSPEFLGSQSQLTRNYNILRDFDERVLYMIP